MEERSQGTKRKRVNDYPRVTFKTGARTFDRLLKESTLNDLKEGVRKKLGYASEVPLQFAQLRDGGTVDLEDDDDFEAFCAAASSASSVTVVVNAPANAPHFTPAGTTPLPPTRPPSTEPPKKRKKKKKSATEEADKPEEPVDAYEKPGQKRKAPPTEPEENAAGAQQTDLAPPKKRKRKDAAAQEALASSADKSEKAAAEPTQPTSEDKAPEEGAKESKKRKNKKLAAIAQEVAETNEPAPAKDAVNSTKEAENPKGKSKKRKAEKEKEVDKGKEQGNSKPKAKDPAKEVGQGTDKGGSELEVLIQNFEKKVAADNMAKPAEGSNPSHTSDAEDDTPPANQGKTAAPVKPTAKESDVNGKAKSTKVKGKETESADAHPTAPPQQTDVVPPGKKTKASKKRAKEVPEPANKAAILASMDAMLAAKKKDQLSAIVEPTEREAPPVTSVISKKATAAEKAKEAAPADKPAKDPKQPTAPKRSAASEDADESSSEETAEPAPVLSAPPKSTVSRGRRPDICPLCAADPAHPRSRCNIVRQAVKSSIKFLKELQTEQAKNPTPFREAQIEAVEEVIQEKQGKVKEKEEAKKKKGVSDEGAVVTGIGAAPAASAKIVTTETKTTSATTKQKPGAQANHRLVTISASTARQVNTTPLDGGSDESTAGPSAAQQQQKPAPSTAVSGHADSQKQKPAPHVSSKQNTQPKPTRARKNSSSESSESSDDESPPTRVPASKTEFRPKSAALASASTTQQTAKSKGPTQGKTVYQWSDEDIFPSISRGSSSQSSRTVVAPPPPTQPQVSTKSQKPHPLSQAISIKASQKKPADSDSDSDSEDDSDDEIDLPAATLPASVFSTGFPDLTNASLADMDIDAVIRGPRVSISTKDLPSSDSSEDGEDGSGSVDPEGLAEDDEPEVSRRTSKMFNAAAVGSSDEEESDEDAEESVEEAPAQRPPRLSLSAALKSKSQSDSEDEAEEEVVEGAERDGRQGTPEKEGLSFGDVNGMASSVEIDSRGDRAFSEALAEDTAVFNLAAPSVEASSRGSSGRTTPVNAGPVGEEDEEEEEEEAAETATAKPAKDDRDDPIEPFGSPIKTQAPPRSPIVDADILQSTPRSLRSKMKGKDGKSPTSPITPAAPNPSMKKAMNLWIGLAIAEKEKKAKEKAAKEKAKAAAAQAAQEEAEEDEEDEELEPVPEKPVRGKRAAAAKAAKLTSQSLKPPSTRSQKAPAATQPAPSVKPPTKATRSSKAPPATQPLPAVTPGRTTRAAAKRAASVQPENPAPPPPTQVTQGSVHKWETLPADSSSQPDETMNMVDELQSLPEEEDENLFIASETQQSFPYSQWQTAVKEKKELHYHTEEEDEDEEDEVLHALDKPSKSLTPVKKKPAKYDFTTLSQLTTQGRTFRTSLPTAGLPKAGLNKKRRETMADLVGLTGEEPSDESGAENSDSGSDAEKPAPSHIPKGRRAGVRSRR